MVEREPRRERPHSGEEPDECHQQAAPARRCGEFARLRPRRRLDQCEHVAEEQRRAEGEHEPDDEIVTEEVVAEHGPHHAPVDDHCHAV